MKGSVFGKMHLQWFGDEDYSDRYVDDPAVDTDGDDVEVVEVDDLNQPDEEDDSRVVLSPEEFQSLKSQTDTASAFKEGIAQLGEVLNKQGSRGEQVPAQQPGESAEDFKKRVNERLFGDDPYTVLKEVIGRELGPLAQQIGGITSQQAKDLMSVKDDTKKYFNKYKKDIEEFHASLPKENQSNPRSWQYAYDEVLKSKREDIIGDEVEQIVNARLAEMGYGGEGGKASSGGSSSAPGVYMESGGMVGHNVKPKGKSNQVRYTADDKRKADMMGIDIKDYLLAQGRIK